MVVTVIKVWANRRTFHGTGTKVKFGSTLIKLRSSVGSDVELRTRRTNQMNQTKSNFSQTRLNIRYHPNFYVVNLVRRMWRSTFVPETIFRRSVCLKQTDKTCWTIQTYSDELNWARRRTLLDVWPRPKVVPCAERNIQYTHEFSIGRKLGSV